MSAEDFMSFDQLLREATQSVEAELALEDAGWTRLGQTAEVLTPLQRQSNIRNSRLYYTRDPLARQAIRLWTDYTFGSGMTFQAEDDRAQEVLSDFWQAPHNRSILSARGQRKSSDKLLVDGEVFFVLFLAPAGEVTIRWIDPLEIQEIITDPEDAESVLFYRRMWVDRQGDPHQTVYRSATNMKNTPTIDAGRRAVSATDDGVVFHLAYNTIGQRGNPLLLPALDWIKQYRRFLAARVAIMLALTRFAWQLKVKGGQVAVDAQAAKLAVDDDPPEAAAVTASNEGADLKPIKTDSGAKNAEADGRMLKLQVSAATGWPEQYFGDISTGNLATAKTVELPVLKMTQSLQKVWEDLYVEIDELVLAHNDVQPDKWYVDINWPLIAPRDMEVAATALEKVVGVFPQFADAAEVQQMGLATLGIDDVAEVLDNLEAANPDAATVRALRKVREVLVTKGGDNGHG